MVNVFVVPSLVQPEYKTLFLDDDPVPTCDIADMVKAYRDKIRENDSERVPPMNELHKIEADNEYLALVLSKKSIDAVRTQIGCDALVALFAVEPDKNRNTIILMALDETGQLLRDETGDFGKAEETWPMRLPVNIDDADFGRFFHRLGTPCL